MSQITAELLRSALVGVSSVNPAGKTVTFYGHSAGLLVFAKGTAGYAIGRLVDDRGCGVGAGALHWPSLVDEVLGPFTGPLAVNIGGAGDSVVFSDDGGNRVSVKTGVPADTVPKPLHESVARVALSSRDLAGAWTRAHRIAERNGRSAVGITIGEDGSARIAAFNDGAGSVVDQVLPAKGVEAAGGFDAVFAPNVGAAIARFLAMGGGFNSSEATVEVARDGSIRFRLSGGENSIVFEPCQLAEDAEAARAFGAALARADSLRNAVGARKWTVSMYGRTLERAAATLSQTQIGRQTAKMRDLRVGHGDKTVSVVPARLSVNAGKLVLSNLRHGDPLSDLWEPTGIEAELVLGDVADSDGEFTVVLAPAALGHLAGQTGETTLRLVPMGRGAAITVESGAGDSRASATFGAVGV